MASKRIPSRITTSTFLIDLPYQMRDCDSANSIATATFE